MQCQFSIRIRPLRKAEYSCSPNIRIRPNNTKITIRYIFIPNTEQLNAYNFRLVLHHIYFMKMRFLPAATM